MEYQKILETIFPLVREHEKISNSQIVDFFVYNLWDVCVPEKIRQLYKTSGDAMENLMDHVCVKEFYDSISSVDLDTLFPLKQFRRENLNTGEIKSRKHKQRFQSDKKWHEIERLAEIVDENIGDQVPLIIDAGAGKGYLSTYISQNYDLPVLAIEASNNVFHSALNYKDLLEKKTHTNYQQVKYIRNHINELTDYTTLAQVHYPEIPIENNLHLIGLHTCGSLAYSVVQSFLKNKDIKVLCVVPCCYHLSDSCFDPSYSLSRNQRMLAQQRFVKTLDVASYHPSLFYRSVLQVILHSLGLSNAKIGRGVFHEDFSVYAKKALIKIGLERDKIPSNESLEAIYNKYKSEQWKFNLFHTLRLLIAPLLEIVILLDVALHLEKSGCCTNVELRRVFDNAVSPRSYCIIAKK